MEISFGKYKLYFGRPKNEPDRLTEQMVNLLPFIYIKRQKQALVKPNANQLRNFSYNPVVRLAINLIKDGVLKNHWKLTNVKTDDINTYEQQKLITSNIINNPNGEDDFESFFSAELEDSLVGDALAFEKARSGNPSKPLWLYRIDGLSIKMNANLKDNYRYVQEIDGKDIAFTSDTIAYIKRTNRNNSLFGISPLEVVFGYVNALTNTFNYSSSIASDALPKYALNLVGAGQKLDEVRTYFVNDCMGEVSLPIFSADKIESAQIAPISEDATFMKYQNFLATFISHEFGVPAEFLGIEKANDRSTFEEKYSQFVENALKPYGKIIEKAINHHIIKALGYSSMFKFEFIWEQTLDQKIKHSDLITKQYQMDIITANQALKELGYPKSDDEWADERISVYKAKVNERFQINGFGDAKDNYSDKPTSNKMDN